MELKWKFNIWLDVVQFGTTQTINHYHVEMVYTTHLWFSSVWFIYSWTWNMSELNQYHMACSSCFTQNMHGTVPTGWQLLIFLLQNCAFIGRECTENMVTTKWLRQSSKVRNDSVFHIPSVLWDDLTSKSVLYSEWHQIASLRTNGRPTQWWFIVQNSISGLIVHLTPSIQVDGE